MKNRNKIINVGLLLFSIVTFAQVKIGANPTIIGSSSAVEIESANKALLLTRVANTAAITNPNNGMLIYDISSSCVKIYQNAAWSDCLGNNIPIVAAITCGSATFSPASFTIGTPYTGTFTVPYSSSNSATYAAGTAIASTGITGLTATLTAGPLATCGGNLTYNVTGTPSGSVGAHATFAISFGGQSCNVVF
jgi:hypothetical protein